MPLFAALLSSIGTSIFTLIASLVGAKLAVRLLAVATLATAYVSGVVLFSTTIAPWISSVFTSQYGQLLGLLFPPVSGTVLAALSAYWASVIGFKYVASLTKMAVG